MNRFVALLQLFLAAILALLAIATLVNSILIAPRPETISVLNAIVGQAVVIIALLALATISFRKGMGNLRREQVNQENQE